MSVFATSTHAFPFHTQTIAGAPPARPIQLPCSQNVTSHPIHPMTISIPTSRDLAARLGARPLSSTPSRSSSGEGRPRKLFRHGIPSVLLPAPNAKIDAAPKSAPPISRRPSSNGSGSGSFNLVPYKEMEGSTGTTYFYRTPIPSSKQRINQACEKCRDRKTKCTGEKPSCNRCVSRGLTCEYAPQHRVRGPNRNRNSLAPGNAITPSPSPKRKVKEGEATITITQPEVIDLVEADYQPASAPATMTEFSLSSLGFDLTSLVPSDPQAAMSFSAELLSALEQQPQQGTEPRLRPATSMPQLCAPTPDYNDGHLQLPQSEPLSAASSQHSFELPEYVQDLNWDFPSGDFTSSGTSSSMSSQFGDLPEVSLDNFELQMQLQAQLETAPPPLTDEDFAALFGFQAVPEIDMVSWMPQQPPASASAEDAKQLF